jgi:hypothetical protein
MFPSLRFIGVGASVVAALMSVSCSLFSHTSGAPPDTNLSTQVHAHPLLHEALVSSSSGHSRHPLDILYPPPSPLPEQPSSVKPAGDDVIWAPGYWIWDTNEDNWHWVHGVWVHAPRGRRWIPGYWSVVADGWRWVPGQWAIDPPPAPLSPPSAYVYSPSGYSYGYPDFAFFTGYGMWWPGYSYWPYHHVHHRGGIAAAIVSPGSHPAEPMPVPLPALASNVHDAPALPSHFDMQSVLASVPKPLASSFNPHESFELHTAHPLVALHAASQGHSERISSLFSTAAHMDTALHEHLISHGSFGTHSLSSASGHAMNSHSSAGHAGGHSGGGHGR